MSDAKLRSVRVSRLERRAGSGFAMATLRAANDNRPQGRESRASLILGRRLMVAVAFCGVAALLTWLGWTALSL